MRLKYHIPCSMTLKTDYHDLKQILRGWHKMQWQPDRKPGTQPRIALQLEPATVCLDQFPRDAEAQTQPLREALTLPPTDKWLEHFLLQFQRDAGARITDPHPKPLIFCISFDIYCAPSGRVFDGITDQISNYLVKPQRVGLHYW